jgi:phosphatidylglycerol:prolipoprotein diacylglycerol transferase
MIDHAGVAALVHALFEYGAIALGVALYRRARLQSGLGGLTQGGGFAVVAGLLVGAALGNKLVFLIERPDVLQRLLDGDWAMPGQSVVGGLLGGLIGVELAKSLTGQTRSTGDAMVWPIAIGLAFGRIGCFIAGLHDDTYGIATSLPWGVDFGDGVSRHPTQWYDAIVALGLAAAVHGRFARVPGLRFKLFLSGYLLWRFGIDGLKPVPHAYALGWSGIQWVCALALAAYAPIVHRHWKRQFDGARRASGMTRA